MLQLSVIYCRVSRSEPILKREPRFLLRDALSKYYSIRPFLFSMYVEFRFWSKCSLILFREHNLLSWLKTDRFIKYRVRQENVDTHFFRCKYLTSRLTKGQRKSPIEVSISGKSMVGFEGLWVHDNF